MINAIGRAQGSISSRAGFRERFIMSEPKERRQMTMDHRSAEYAARTGRFNDLNVQQQQSVLRGLNNLGNTIYRGPGQFQGMTAQEIKSELLKTDADRRDEAEIKAREEEIHRARQDAWTAWTALANDHKAAATALLGAANAITAANNGQPDRPVAADPVGPNGQPIAPLPGGAPPPPGLRPPLSRGASFARANDTDANNEVARRMENASQQNNEAAGRMERVAESQQRSAEEYRAAAGLYPTEMVIKSPMQEALPMNWDDMNANERRNHLGGTRQERIDFWRNLNRREREFQQDFNDLGPLAF
jgi:hypothetical protein